MSRTAEKNPSLKRSLRWTFRAAVLGGCLWAAAPPEQALEDGHSYAPNDVQQEFLRLAAAKYDYVTLGDTEHPRPEINIFATSKETVGALAAGGDRYFFTEAGPWAQGYIDAVRTTPPGAEDKFRHRWSDTTMWVCNADVRQRMNTTFEASVRANPSMNFIGADQRQNGDSEASRAETSAKFVISIGIPVTIYQGIYGCVSEKAFIPGGIVYALTGDSVLEKLTDDRYTHDYIRSVSPQGGTIFYGAGHFDDKPGRLKTLLEADGVSVGHINIYADDAQRRHSPAHSTEPDAYLTVKHEGRTDYGVHANTPEMQDLYDQAVKNVQARRAAPAPKA
jgi:hypothetical protein